MKDPLLLLELCCRLREAERSVDVLCWNLREWPGFTSYIDSKLDPLRAVVEKFAGAYIFELEEPESFNPYIFPEISRFRLCLRNLTYLTTGIVKYSEEEVVYIVSSYRHLVDFSRSESIPKSRIHHLRYSLGTSQCIIRRSVCGHIRKYMHLRIEQFLPPLHLELYSVDEVLNLYQSSISNRN
jgi:hypothetical protein